MKLRRHLVTLFSFLLLLVSVVLVITGCGSSGSSTAAVGSSGGGGSGGGSSKGVTLSTTVKSTTNASASISRSASSSEGKSVGSVSKSVSSSSQESPVRVVKAVVKSPANGAKCSLLKHDGTVLATATADSSGVASTVVDPSLLDNPPRIVWECKVGTQKFRNYSEGLKQLKAGDAVDAGDTGTTSTAMAQQILQAAGATSFSSSFAAKVTSGKVRPLAILNILKKVKPSAKSTSIKKSVGVSKAAVSPDVGLGGTNNAAQSYSDFLDAYESCSASGDSSCDDPSVINDALGGDVSKLGNFSNVDLNAERQLANWGGVISSLATGNNFESSGDVAYSGRAQFIGNQTTTAAFTNMLSDDKAAFYQNYMKQVEHNVATQGIDAAFAEMAKPGIAQILGAIGGSVSSAVLTKQAVFDVVDALLGNAKNLDDASPATLNNMANSYANMFSSLANSAAGINTVIQNPDTFEKAIETSPDIFGASGGDVAIGNLVNLERKDPTLFTASTAGNNTYCLDSSSCASGQKCGNGICMSSAVSSACKHYGCSCSAGSDCSDDTSYCSSGICGCIADSATTACTSNAQCCSQNCSSSGVCGTPAAIAAPNDLVATADATRVTLTWTLTGAASYKIYRSTSTPVIAPDNYWTLIKAASSPATQQTYLDSAPVRGTIYYYAVAASSGNVDSVGLSNEVNATAP